MERPTPPCFGWTSYSGQQPPSTLGPAEERPDFLHTLVNIQFPIPRSTYYQLFTVYIARNIYALIGPSTIRVASAVGLRAIAVEAEGVLLLERARVVDLCREQGISLIGISC